MSTTVKIAYVSGNQGKTEFEIHAAGCTHLKRLHPWADVTIHEVPSVDEFVAAEVEVYDYQDQGWTAEDFHVLPCARKAEKDTRKTDAVHALAVALDAADAADLDYRQAVAAAANLARIATRHADADRLDLARIATRHAAELDAFAAELDTHRRQAAATAAALKADLAHLQAATKEHS